MIYDYGLYLYRDQEHTENDALTAFRAGDAGVALQHLTDNFLKYSLVSHVAVE